MHDRAHESLNDPLAREIEAALAVDPSPAFQSRVRVRLAQEPGPGVAASWWLPPRAFAALVVVGAVAAFMAIGWQVWPSRDLTHLRNPAPGAPNNAAVTGVVGQPAMAAAERVSSVQPGSRRTPTAQTYATKTTIDWLASVMIDRDEVEGMRALVADARAGRFELVSVPVEPADVAPLAPASDAVAPEAVSNDTTSTVPLEDSAAAPATRAAAGESDSSEEALAEGRSAPSTTEVAMRPIVIRPVTIDPLVERVPGGEFEGAAE